MKKYPMEKDVIQAVLSDVTPHRAIELKNLIKEYKERLLSMALLSVPFTLAFIGLMVGGVELVAWLGYGTAPDWGDPTPFLILVLLPMLLFMGGAIMWDNFISRLNRIIEDGVKNGSE